MPQMSINVINYSNVNRQSQRYKNTETFKPFTQTNTESIEMKILYLIRVFIEILLEILCVYRNIKHFDHPMIAFYANHSGKIDMLQIIGKYKSVRTQNDLCSKQGYK